MKKRIMVIDDDPQIRQMYKLALEMHGYEVVAEPDGEKALATLMKDDHKPDLILLDIMMPNISGLNVLSMIKTEPATRNIKVIMLSALSDLSIKEKAALFGAHSYIVKSELSMPDMIKKIEEAIRI
jgi:CheY-like chemotaxis protein